jgi:hypothetical protein
MVPFIAVGSRYRPAMCRWLAYAGNAIPIDWLTVKASHSLIDQSLHARLGETTTNGDGFGIGWYDDSETPGLYRSMRPAWSDRNLRELAAHVSSRLFFAHVRASTGSAVQGTNCHPFRYGRWLFMHNGVVHGFARLKRDLLVAVDASLVAARRRRSGEGRAGGLAAVALRNSGPMGVTGMPSLWIQSRKVGRHAHADLLTESPQLQCQRHQRLDVAPRPDRRQQQAHSKLPLVRALAIATHGHEF